MAYISEYKGNKSLVYNYCNKEQEMTLRNSEEVIYAAEQVRKGDEKYKSRTYTWLTNGTSCEPKAYRGQDYDYLISNGLMFLDFDAKDGKKHLFANVMKIFKPHVDEWGVALIEKSMRGGTHVLVRMIEGLTQKEMLVVFNKLTGLSADDNALGVKRCCYLVPESYIGYINDELYFSMEPHQPLPMKEEYQQIINEYNAEQERLHQLKIAQRRAQAIALREEGTDSERIEQIVDAIDRAGVPLDDYNEWVELGLVLGYALGEGGRYLFHRLSHNSTKYNAYECDKKYDNLVQTSRGEVTIGTLVWWAKGEGVVL